MNRSLCLGALVVIAGCSAVEPKAAAMQVETVKLEAGTPVKAVLLRELTSGGTREGEDVPLMVSEDLKDSKGRVLIPKGTPITGKVTWSRSEGTLGSLLNQPARLKVKVESLSAVSGAKVTLSATKDKGAEIELNRENTGKIVASDQLQKIAEDKPSEEALAAIRELFESGEATKLESPETRAKLASIAQQMGLAKTNQVVAENNVDKVTDLVQQIRRGATITNLATGGSATLVDAALELAGIAGQVGNRLERIVGGRNIRAYVGTPVDLYIVETVEIKVPGS